MIIFRKIIIFISIDFRISVSRDDHTDNDCLVIILLTHGELPQGVTDSNILSHDNEIYIRTRDKRFALQKVFRYFTDERCPTLIGKPRLFFVQACQGNDVDEGCILKQTSDTKVERDSILVKSKQRILPHKDFLVAYSSRPGFASFRNAKGSWFIRELCAVLNAFKHKCDLMKMLTFTCQNVAYECESIASEKNPHLNKKKQMPYIQSMLTKVLMFEKQVTFEFEDTNL